MQTAPTLQEKLKLFLALSRTPHGLIDMATPALAALLCLGHFPPAAVTLVGLLTVFAGYTAVYALNDLVDLKTDIKKVAAGVYDEDVDQLDLDGVLVRHPIATGALSLGAGLLWTAAWSAVALLGAYWLNPVCLYLFLAGCLLEAIYCRLWRVTPWRTVINGIVKTLGALAAVFAVNPDPPLLFLAALFFWLFFWEIGGQNIPNDWSDIEEDRRFNAQTVPVRFGQHRAGLISVGCLVAVLFFNLFVWWASPLPNSGMILFIALLISVFLLLKPALTLAQNNTSDDAMRLFNQASYYPLTMLGLVLIQLLMLD